MAIETMQTKTQRAERQNEQNLRGQGTISSVNPCVIRVSLTGKRKKICEETVAKLL